jgi:hypothetical protein
MNLQDTGATVRYLIRDRDSNRDIARLRLVQFAGLVSDVASCPLCGKGPPRVEQARCW